MDAHTEVLDWVELRQTSTHVTAIRNCKGVEKRQAHYKKLIKYTRKTLGIVKDTLRLHSDWLDWAMQTAHIIPLIKLTIDKTDRRVIKGESVPVEEKVVSPFPHTDIIVKDKRQVQYGHKINSSDSTASRIVLFNPLKYELSD